MRAFKSTLTFILGMIIGIILFIIAIGGTIFGIGTLVSIGDLDKLLGTDIIEDNSEFVDKTILEVVQSLIDDINNFDKLTVQKLIDTYGLPIPREIAGIDITPVFKYPILEVPNHLSDILDGVTLKQIGNIAGINFPDLPILMDNVNLGVANAVEAIMGAIKSDMTIRSIEDNFGISLGENQLLDNFKDASISSFAALINALPLGSLLAIDCDSFITAGINDVFVKTTDATKYEEVAAADFGKIKDGAKTYISSVGANGRLINKELRFIKKTTTIEGNTTTKYVVNNSSNAEGFVPGENEQTYYRLREFVPYSTLASYPVGTEFFVKAYLNGTEIQSDDTFRLKPDAMLSLKTLYTSNALTSTLNDSVLSSTIDIASFFMAPAIPGGEAVEYKSFGIEQPLTKDSTFDETLTGYLRAHIGESSALIQSLVNLTVATIGDAGDDLLNIRLGDIINIDTSSSEFLQKNKNKTLKEMTEGFDNFCLADFMSVSMGAYVPSTDGAYTYIADGNYYTLFNPAVHTASELERFKLIPGYAAATDAQILAGTGLYYYDGTQMKEYSRATDGAKDKLFIKGAPTSKILQRLVGVNLKDFATAFNSISLSDVLDIDVDTYAFVSNLTAPYTSFSEGTDYYYFDSAKNMYLDALVFDTTFRTAHNGEKIYTLSSSGGANAILKRLAFLKINEMGERMGEVFLDLRISDILPLIEHSQVKLDTSTDASASGKWFIPSVDALTVGTGDSAEYYAYVYNANGKYYKSNGGYGLASNQDKTPNGNAYFKYVSLNGYNATSYATLVASTPNAGYLYFKNADEKYVFNPAVTTYLLTNGQFAKLYYRASGSESDIMLPKYVATNLYVNVAGANNPSGSFVSYDPTMFAHLDAELYVKYNDADSHFFRVNGTPPTGAALYSKERCDYVYFEDANGTFVYIGGKYVAYTNQVGTRYSRQMGIVVDRDGNFTNNSGNFANPISTVKVIVNEEVSTGILKAFANNNVTMANIGTAMDTLKLGDILPCEEGSMLYDFKNSTLQNLSADLGLKLSTMTIGQMLEWSGINTIDAKVKGMLEGVSITDFFLSIEFSETNGLVININKLFGIV